MQNIISRSLIVALASIGLLSAADDNNQGNNNNQGEDTPPNGKGGETKPIHDGHSQGGAKTSGNGISYHGGPVMVGLTNKIYYIWYGNWGLDPGANNILTVLAKSIGGSPYFNINTTYYNGSGTHVSNAVAYGGYSIDNYSQGSTLTDQGVANVVANALNTHALPTDANGIYFVLTSPDVNESSGFCTQYCGWHWYGSYTGTSPATIIKYAFVGDPLRCPSACTNGTPPPNGTASTDGGDGMASTISHELEEAVTDPQGSAWYDSRGNENADKCAWNFGATSTTSSGGVYNMTLGGLNYLIQQNWVNANGGRCALSY